MVEIWTTSSGEKRENFVLSEGRRRWLAWLGAQRLHSSSLLILSVGSRLITNPSLPHPPIKLCLFLYNSSFVSIILRSEKFTKAALFFPDLVSKKT